MIGVELRPTSLINGAQRMSVRITHPTGASMAHSESLSAFLQERDSDCRPFHFGDWLESIDEGDLKHISELAMAFLEGDESPQTDDLLSVALIARAAELQCPNLHVTSELLDEWVKVVYVVATVESFRRCGWLLLNAPLSIFAEAKICVTVTPEGMLHKAGRNFFGH